MAYFKRGHACIKIGNYKQAIADYNKAIELNPKDELAYLGRGYAYEMLGKHEQAIADFKIAASLGDQAAQKYLIAKEIEAFKNVVISDDKTTKTKNSTPRLKKQIKKRWVTVIEQKGKTSKNTDTFTLHGGKAKLKYSFKGKDEFGAIYVLPEGYDFQVRGGVPDVHVYKATTDSTFLVKKAGNYYLNILGNNWVVKIEEEI